MQERERGEKRKELGLAKSEKKNWKNGWEIRNRK